MKKWFGRTGIALLVLVLAIFIALATWEPFWAKRDALVLADRTYTAEIIRDEFGVPHIYGDTDADVAYGVAFAHSEDDFSTLQDVIAMSRGRYGAIAGQDGAAFDYAYHLLDARGLAERDYPQLPKDTRALFDAYAAGLNDFAAAHPGERKLANLFPVDGVDVAAGFALRQPFFFGLGNVIEPLVSSTPLKREQGPAIPGAGQPAPGEDAAPIVRTSHTPRTRNPAPLPYADEAAFSGSNAFAVTPEKSGGPTTLISNSHQPWRGGVAWYELVVESGEGWHFAGANFPGSPFPFLGHNADLGWTNTVNTPDMVDVYQLVLDDSGTRYRLDGEWRELEQRTVTLPVRLGPVVLPIRRDIYRSAHGPVIKNDKGAFAIRYGGMGNLGQLDAYYRLNKAASLDEWQGILARMDIPSTNFIYADKAGNIANIYNAAIPARPATVGGERIDWRGILPGDRSDLITRGSVSYDQLPRYVNPASGWLVEANNNPFLDAGAGSNLSPGDFPPELGIELKDTNRGTRGAKLMAEAEVLDRAALERIKYDTAYENSGYIAQMLRDVAAIRTDDPDLLAAQRLLGEWDLTADNIGRGDSLALLMIRPFMGSSYSNDPWPDAEAELQRSVDHLLRHFGRIDPPMGELLRLRQGDVDLPLDGGSDTLRASTLWDIDDDGRLSVRHGDSFIQWVEWMPGERVSSRSIQPFGSATTRPASPHYADQSTLFVQHRLKPVHFWREDVLANAASRKTVTNRR